MRRTGSRESRDNREASATSPTSIAVKTFSIRFGSRRIQRPSHQKMRSRTTARAVSETTRIGHMMGPPFLKLSTKKFLSNAPPAAGLAAGEPPGVADAPAAVVVVVVAGDMAAVAGVVPGIGEMPGAVGLAPGAVVIAVEGAAGVVTGAVTGAVVVVAGAVAGLVAVVGGAAGALVAGEVAAGGDWPNEVSTRVTEQRLAVSSVFIGLIAKFCRALLR